MKKNIQAFTLVELIVVATILVILATMGFAAFSDSIPNARDAERKSGIAQIESALNRYHQERSVLPMHGSDTFNITLGANTVAIQGKFDNTVRLSKLKNLPVDPKIQKPYTYSTTNNRQEFQLAATLENGDIPVAYLQGNYMTVSLNRLPTIVVADNQNIDVTSDQDKFVFDNLEYNLPYDLNDDPIYGPYSDGIVTLNDMKSDANLIYWHKTDFRSCEEIKSAGKSIGDGEYQILTNGVLTNTNCSGM